MIPSVIDSKWAMNLYLSLTNSGLALSCANLASAKLRTFTVSTGPLGRYSAVKYKWVSERLSCSIKR